MKSTVINNFIDNKIRTAFCEKKSVLEVLDILERRIEDTNKSEKMRKAFRDYMNSFAKKRINDILFIKSKQRFNDLPDGKILNIIRLKDKISGFSEFEIHTNIDIFEDGH